MDLYGVQQHLARLQMQLEKNHDLYSVAACARRQKEEELQSVRLRYAGTCETANNERKKRKARGPRCHGAPIPKCPRNPVARPRVLSRPHGEVPQASSSRKGIPACHPRAWRKARCGRVLREFAAF